MRRALIAALAAPAILLAACSGGSDDPKVEPPPTTDTIPTSDTPTTANTAPTVDAGPTTDTPPTTDTVPTTDTPTSDTPTTDTNTTDTNTGGSDSEGQAAADRTEEWLVAFVKGEPEVCDYMLSFTDEKPMKDSQTDYDVCKSMIPPLAKDMFDNEMVSIIESMKIDGATVKGDTATVGKDNFSKLFAQGIGDQVITLKKVDGEWYVNLEKSFK